MPLIIFTITLFLIATGTLFQAARIRSYELSIGGGVFMVAAVALLALTLILF